MSTIQLHTKLFTELERIFNAGHSVSIKKSEDKGNSHTSTYIVNIVINVRHPNESAFINKLLVKCTISYGILVRFYLSDGDCDELQYGDYSDLKEALNFINSKLDFWREMCNSENPKIRAAWQNKMAKIED